MTYIKRVGRSNSRVTRDKLYLIQNDFRGDFILDDRGNRMTPCASPQFWNYEITNSPNFITKQTEKDMKAIQIETVTLINGNRDYDLEDVLKLIRKNEEAIRDLERFDTPSKVFDKLVERHQNTINQLVDVLETMEIS